MLGSAPLKNERLLKTIRREPIDRTPIWLMRQAGRYLPEYRALRAKAGSFMQLCKTPDLACEVTLQPVQRYDLDAAIIFSDILTIPDAMGFGLQFIEGQGPVFDRCIRHEKDIMAASLPDLANLAYVYDAIRLVKKELAGKIPLIGFCGSPWTLAAYMIEGKSQANFPTAMKFLEQEPQLLHCLLEQLADAIAMHLEAQIAAGVQAVMLFDTWGYLLAEHYETFSLPYIKYIFDKIKKSRHAKDLPIILFAKGRSKWLEQLATTGCDVVSLDWEISLKDARARIGHQVTLQGNMPPSCLLSAEAEIVQTAQNILAAFGQGSGHIFNLGHGITPDVPPEHVKVLIDVVHEMSQPYHFQNH